MTKSDRLLGYIKASSYRSKIIKALEGKKLTPIELAKETNIPLSHVSNTLADLWKEELVICTNPTARKGRIYTIGKEGRSVLKDLT